MPLAYSTSLSVSGAAYPLSPAPTAIIATATIPAAIFNGCTNPVITAGISYSISGVPTHAIPACNVYVRFPSGSNTDWPIISGQGTSVPFLAGAQVSSSFVVHSLEGTFPAAPLTADMVLTIQADASNTDVLTVDALAVFMVYDAVNLKQYDVPVPFLGPGTPDHNQVTASRSSPLTVTGIHSPANTIPNFFSAAYFIWMIAGVASGSPSTPSFDPNWSTLIAATHGNQWGAIGEYFGSLTDLTPIDIQAMFGATSWLASAELFWGNPISSSGTRSRAYIIG